MEVFERLNNLKNYLKVNLLKHLLQFFNPFRDETPHLLELCR